jgi:hypothetical protein
MKKYKEKALSTIIGLRVAVLCYSAAAMTPWENGHTWIKKQCNENPGFFPNGDPRTSAQCAEDKCKALYGTQNGGGQYADCLLGYMQ